MLKVAMVIGRYPAVEQKRREDVIQSYASAEVEIGIIRLSETPYVRGLTPAELQLLAPSYIRAFQSAQTQGYHAVVPFGVLDIGVDGGRSAVDIPVVGPCEACLCVASQLGDRFGMLAYHAQMIPYLSAIVRHYGMQDRIAGWRSTGLELPDMAASEEHVVARVVQEARSLVEEEHAEVIIPMGVSQCPVLLGPEVLSAEVGVPVVDGIGAALRMAALLAGLGLRHSRKRWPRSSANCG